MADQVFEFELPDGSVVEVEAPNEAAALKGFQSQFRGSAPAAPGGGGAMHAAFPQRLMEAGIGAAKGLGKTAVGAVEAGLNYGPVGMADAVVPTGFREKVSGYADQAREALAPSNPTEQQGQSFEQFAEFFAPGAAGLKVPGVASLGKYLGPALQAGTETALVDTAQRGHVDPGAVAMGAGMGGALSVAGRGLKAMGRFVKEKGVERFSKIAPARGTRGQERVNEAIADALEKGEAPVGGIRTLEEAQKGRVNERMADVTASRQANADTPIDIRAIMQDLRDQLTKRSSDVPQPRVTEMLDDVVDPQGNMEVLMKGKQEKYAPIKPGAPAPVEDAFAGKPGGPRLSPRELERAVAASERSSASSEASSMLKQPTKVVHDEAFMRQLRPYMAKLAEMRRRGLNTAEPLEKQRDAWSKIYEKDAPERASGLAGTEKRVHDTIVRHLDEAIPGRQAINRDFSTNKALQEALTRGRINQGAKGTTNPGEAGGMRALLATALKVAGVGAATGGNPAAMIATPLVEGAIRSPLGRSAGAVAQYGAGRALDQISPDMLRRAGQAAGAEMGDADEAAPSMRRETVEQEIIQMLEDGDKAGARQRALQYKRATGDRIDTRELELAVSGGER